MSLSNSLKIHSVLSEVQRPVLSLIHLMTQGLVIKQNAQPPAEPVSGTSWAPFTSSQ